jgi:RHS repeat-associated protein
MRLGRLTSVCEITPATLNGVAPASCGQTTAATGFLTQYSDAFGNVKKDYYVDSQQYPGTTFLAKYSNSYPNNRFQTVPASTCPLQYDSNGNLLCDGTHTYTWDLDNRLTTIDGGTPSLFDAFDRRVEFNGISQLLYPPFDPGYHLGIASQQALGGIRLPLPGGIQAIYNSTGLAEYRIANWQTSEPLTVTPSHTVTIDSHYSPFGEPYAGVSGGYNGFFAGMYAISAHGFIGDSYEANFRLYNYQQGRWISPDPAGLAAVDLTNPQSFNRYAYALNDPLQFMDPIGLQGVNCGAGRHWQANSNGDGGQCVGDQPNPGTTLFINSCAQLLLYAPQYAYLCNTGPTGPNGSNVGGGTGGNPAPKSGSCDAGVVGNFISKNIGRNTILSANITSNTLTIALGDAIGSVGGPVGAFVGGLVGSMFGVGGGISYVPGTGSIYAGPIATFGVGINGGSGFSVSAVHVPSGQNANSIASGKSFSLTYQPNPFLGSTVTKSPGSGPPVVGPSMGTKVPVSASAGYSFCLWHCGC